ncbi:MAG TPA: hypothetical protein PKD55_17600, partial [Bellilinea sp.]|nr:hypothetical protein [Bellilinea sp.]
MAVIVSDTFTDTSQTALTAHAPDTDSVGSGWVNDSGSVWKVTNANGAYNGATQNNSHIVIDSGQADCKISGRVLAVGSGSTNQIRDVGLVVRWVDASNYWKVSLNDSANVFRIIQ